MGTVTIVFENVWCNIKPPLFCESLNWLPLCHSLPTFESVDSDSVESRLGRSLLDADTFSFRLNCATIILIMNTITIQQRQLRSIIRESVREILVQETSKFRALLVPSVSQNEQKDIEKRYGKPSRSVSRSIEITL